MNVDSCNEKQPTYKTKEHYNGNNSNSRTSYNQKSLQESQSVLPEDDNKKKGSYENYQNDWFNENLTSIQPKSSKNRYRKEETLNNLLNIQPLIPEEKDSTHRISPTVIFGLPDELLNLGENNVSQDIEDFKDLKEGTKTSSALKTTRNLAIKDKAQNANRNKAVHSKVSRPNLIGPLGIFIPSKRVILQTDIKSFNIVDVVHPVKYGFNVDEDSIRFECNNTFVRVRIPKTLKSTESIEQMLFAHIYSADS